AKDQTGRIAKKIVNVEKPTDNLQISLDIPEKIVEATEVSIKGKVSRKNITENATNRAIWVFVNGIEADVIPDEKFVSFDFEATIPVTYGRNRIEINVRTNDGFTKKVLEIPNFKKSVIELQIDNDIANINGQQKQIDAKPYISQGRTFVPFRVIAEGFGAQVDWVQQTKGINITLGDKVISMQIGSTRAIINNQVVTMDAAPEIKSGRTFVPIRFVSEALGAEVEWNQSTRKVIITRLTME
ncbi:MAG: copper amine oxidase N-terminal domain-containing protein, partial [Caldisericia bacterium]|nr:copper amine oxidase N-terminal domain-containing protein [Caldisericia bacterium]